MDIKGIYLMPSYHNPTSITMSSRRRQELSRVIKEQDITLIEDDTYGFMTKDKLPPLATLIPENTIYVHGLSKSLSAGLRIAYVVVPDKYQKLFYATANNITLKIPLLNAEIASELIASGTAKEIIKRNVCFQRNEIGYIQNISRNISLKILMVFFNGFLYQMALTDIILKFRQENLE